MALELSIVTPDREAVHVTCDEVTVPGLTGELGLLEGHVPVITALRPGTLTVIQSGKKTVYAVGSGYAELEAKKVTVLTDGCEEGSEVDVERAKRDIEAADKALEKLGEDDDEYPVHKTRLERAQARLTAASSR